MQRTHNRPKQPNEIEIAPGYSIQRYVNLKKERKGSEIAVLIRTRFDDRFFSPLGYSLATGTWRSSDKTNIIQIKASGWLMITVTCLAIESLIAFTKGLKRVQNYGEEFSEFFKTNAAFTDLLKAFPAFEDTRNEKTKAGNKFYSDIRCGLLHQAETYGGWRLLLGDIGGQMVNDSENMRCIYAKPILAGVGDAIRNYCERLAADIEFTTNRKFEWGKTLRKLDAVAKGCGVKPNDLGNPIRLENQASSRP